MLVSTNEQALRLLKETDLFRNLDQREMLYLASKMSHRFFVRGE